MRPLDKLIGKPIEDLNIGAAAFKRKLKHVGYATLVEAFDASEDEVEMKLGRDFNTLDQLDALKEQYKKSPEAFVARALEERHASSSHVQGSVNHIRVVKHRTAAKPQKTSDSYTHKPPMPSDKLGKELLEFEQRAKSSLDALADRGTDYLAFEAFEDFAAEIDRLSSRFMLFLRRYQGHMRLGFDTIAAHLPNAFIIFCADQVRTAYDGENLWGNLFGRLELSTQGQQVEFKRLMIDCLEKRGMPTYGFGERDFYYFYTAILHGGLTRDLWEDLWQKSLIPMAKQASKDPYSFGRMLDGRTALALMRGGKYAPNATVFNILDKAAESIMVPVFDAALGVAHRLTDPSTSIGVTMLNRSGLPDSALEALSEVRNRSRSSSHDNRGSKGARSTQAERAGDLVYLPEGNLVLDLDEGQARIIWKRSVLPKAYLGDRVDFFVNGSLMRSAEVVSDVTGCLIEGGSVALPPMPGYEVAIKLMHKDREDLWEEQASLEQVFVRTKPGCLEFLQMPDGTFRLRKRGDRITRTRTVAYVIKPGREVAPGPGMRPIEKLCTSEEWGDRMIWLFELDPGSSGAIVESATGRKLATWQEDVTVSMDNSGRLGFTDEGLDLYGVRENAEGNNESMPIIAIEAADGAKVLEDLDVVLTCAGRRYSARQRMLQRDGERSAAIAIILSEVPFFPYFAKHCDIVIRRKSQDVAVFTYSFAVAPVRWLAIDAIDASTMEATYRLRAAAPMWALDNEGRSEKLDKEQEYLIRAPLCDEWALLAIESPDHERRIDARLRLAGVSVKVNDETLSASLDHPLSYADAYELGTIKGRIEITARGASEGRGALMMLGQRPVFFQDLRRPGVHQANLFSDPDLLLRLPETSSELLLKLTVFFGDIAPGKSGWADFTLLRCREGLGFIRPQVLDASYGHILYLGFPATCDLGIEIYRPATHTLNERVLYQCEIKKDEKRAELPSWLVRRLDSHHPLYVRYFPLSLFGVPEYDYSLTLPLER